MRLDHPYSQLTGGRWLRGNLHTHTTRSDGDRAPQAVIDDYASRGYHFLALSDHDIQTQEADYRQWQDRGLILLPGNEISAGGPHLLHIDSDRRIEPDPARQNVLNQITAAAAQTGRGFAIVNHPNWEADFDHCSLARMREWQGYLGMEIYNGVINRLDGSPYATNKWDMLLAGGRRVWGFANDDSHAAQDMALGWNVAYVTRPGVAGVVDALKAGRFYTSTGVVIDAIEVEGLRVRVRAGNARRIVGIHNAGQRFARVDGSTLEVTVPERARYVRFECWGEGEQQAWTQPLWRVEEPAGETATADESPYLRQWRVTPLVEGRSIHDASREEAGGLATVAVAGKGPRDAGPWHTGFVDLRGQIAARAGVVYASALIAAPAPRRGLIFLGYDGPVRVWLNEQMIFQGPGNNPAHPDRVALYGQFQAGENTLTIALDSNRGRAWGLYGRVDLRG